MKWRCRCRTCGQLFLGEVASAACCSDCFRRKTEEEHKDALLKWFIGRERYIRQLIADAEGEDLPSPSLSSLYNIHRWEDEYPMPLAAAEEGAGA